MRLLMLCWLALLAFAGAPALAALPARPDGPVLDAAAIIPDDRQAGLEQKLSAYNKATGRAVMVVTVPSLDGEDVRSYGVNLGHAWGVGGKDTDQGLILLVAPNERKLAIEVGYGLEEFLPDVLAGRIIRESITPRFKARDYPGGIEAGIDAVIAQLSRDPADAKAVAEAAKAAEAQRRSGSRDAGAGSVVFWIGLIVFFMLVFGRRGRRLGRRSGIDPGIVLWGISEALHHSGRGGGWGGGGGGGSGGSDWGGFGGGDFGGGGASGDW